MQVKEGRIMKKFKIPKFKFNIYDSKHRMVLLGTILLVCIICIAVALYSTLFVNKTNKESKIQIGTVNKQNELILKEDFNNIFHNELINNTQEDLSQIEKIDVTKDLVYTALYSTDKKDGVYDLSVEIPLINIKNETIESYNKEIQDTFLSKAMNILTQVEENTIYTVKYVAYINHDILSIVIQSTLKEGSSPQRTIIKTYNFDLENHVHIELEEILSRKRITLKDAEKKISSEIKTYNKNALALQELGYQVFIREENDEMYLIQNAKTFFLGEEDCLYVIYAYGNNHFTNETDLILF